MGKNIRKIISIVMVMLMITPLTWQAYADDSMPDTQESAAQNEQTQDGSAVSQYEQTAQEPAETKAVSETEEGQPADEVMPSTAPAASDAAAAADLVLPNSQEDAVQTRQMLAEVEGNQSEQTAQEPAETKAVSETEEGQPADEVMTSSAPAASDAAAAAEVSSTPDPAGSEAEEIAAPAADSEQNDEAADGTGALMLTTSAEMTEEAEIEETKSINGERGETADSVSETDESTASIAKKSATASASQTGQITVEGQKLDGSTSSSGSGWSYDKESDTILLRDFSNKGNITSDGRGVTIVTSGLNRIGTLSIDGQIDIVGSGILLVDSIELAEGCDLNLLPDKAMYGEELGGAAVFLLQDDGSYLLINGSTKGIVDEEIEIADGTTLVIPADSTIELKALTKKTTLDTEFNVVSCEYVNTYISSADEFEIINYYAGNLKVSNLVLKTGATILNQSLGNMVRASLTVIEKLENNGTISGGDINIDGVYSGSGTLSNANVNVKKGQTASFNISNADLFLNGKNNITDLNISGYGNVYYDDDTAVKKTAISEGGKLDVYSRNYLQDSGTIIFTDSVSGGSINVLSGIVELANTLNLSNGATAGNTSGGVLFNYSTLDFSSNGITGPVFLGPANVVVPSENVIPVVSFGLDYYVSEKYRYNIASENTSGNYELLEKKFDASQTGEEGIISFDDLRGAYIPSVSSDDLKDYAFEVFSCRDGNLALTVLHSDSGVRASSDGVFLIRLAKINITKMGEGGSAQTTTLADRTGSGTIGGNSSSIFKGTGVTRKSTVIDPDPVKPDDPDPVKPDDPDPVKPDDPDPVKPDDPDPVKPDGPDPVKPDDPDPVVVHANTGSIMRLMIDEIVSDEEGNILYYVLSTYMNGSKLDELDEAVEVVMDYELPEGYEDKPLYAVFMEKDEASGETVKAFEAAYDSEDKKLTFETDLLGEFIIVPLEFEGEKYSPEFYDELEKVKEVQTFISLMKEKEENA